MGEDTDVMLPDLSGKVALVTGAGRGIGRAHATLLAELGAAVVVNDLGTTTSGDGADQGPAGEVVAAIAAAGGRAVVDTSDISTFAGGEAAVTRALDAFGRLDVLVNNAGYGLLGAVEEVRDDEIRSQLETNLFGALGLIRALLPHFRAAGAGHILNVSSESGFVGRPGFGIYAASKFGLEGLSESLAQELEPLGVHVTIVEPGPFRTDWVGSSLVRNARVIPDYAASSGRMREFADGFYGKQRGDPRAAARAMADVVAAERPPLRLVLGEAAVREWRFKLDMVRRELDEWEAVARGADFPDGAELPPLGSRAQA
jgi:NAD(P)-dependent dehydrogenase (short-subunit alcohol dehydrogenase family)